MHKAGLNLQCCTNRVCVCVGGVAACTCNSRTREAEAEARGSELKFKVSWFVGGTVVGAGSNTASLTYSVYKTAGFPAQ